MSTIAKGVAGAVEIGVGVALEFVPGMQWAGTMLIGMGVSTLLATAAALLSPAKQTGVHTQIAYDPAFPRQLIVGRTLTAGSLVGQFTHDNGPGGSFLDEGKNRVLEIIIAIADHECDGLEQILVNGMPVNVGSYDSSLGYPIYQAVNPITSTVVADYSGKMWVQFFSGADGQVADAYLTSVLGAAWPSTSVGTNVCYARATCVFDTNLFGSIPSLQFVVRGAKLYDPRLDTTVGGSGSQLWGTPSTYVWSDNLALIAYNLCRGIYVGGDLFFGASASASEVPFAQSVAAMNSCDELVSLKAGGTEKRYIGGGQVAVSQDAQAFLQVVTTSMGGYIGTGGGSIAIFPGVAQTPVISFTDDDIMAREQYDNAPKFGLDTLKNAVFGTYVDPIHNWTRSSAPTRTSTSDITEDGGTELGDSYAFDLIYSPTQAQRVMEIIRRRNRRQIMQTVTLRPSAMVVERGDWVQWTSVQWGYSAKPFRVAAVSLKPNLDTVLSLIEADSTIYDWDPSSDELPPAGGLLPSADPPAALAPTGMAVASLPDLGGDGSSIPRIQVTFDDPKDATVVGAIAEAQVVGSNVSVIGITSEVADELVTIAGQLLPDTQYQVRLILQGIPGRQTTWSSWVLVTTPPSVLPAAPRALIDNSQASLRTLSQNVESNAAAILNLSVALGDQAAAIGTTVAYANQQLTKTITQGLNAEAQARLDLAAIVIGLTTGNTETALAARVTVLESATADLATIRSEAAIASVLDAQINTPTTGLAAQVSSNTTAIATLDPSSATATIQQTAAAARAQGLQIDAMGETLLNIINALQNNAQRIAATVAFYTMTITATVTQGQSAQAQALSDLTAMLQTAGTNLAANIETNNTASVTRDLALTDSITTLSSYFGAGVSPTNTVQAIINNEATTRASADSALSSTTSSLSAALSGLTGSGAVASAISTVTATATSKSTVFVAGTAPTANAIGDLWIDTGNGNAAKTWTGTAWVARPDLNKATTYAQTSAPTAAAVGDLWINTTAGANTMSRWSGFAWVAVDNATIASSSSAITALQNTVNNPTTGVAATASGLASLTTTVTSQGTTLSSLSSSVTSLSSGLSAANSNIAANASAVTSLTTAVNNKSSVFVASSAPTAIAIGDLWINTGSGNTAYTWTGTAWTPRADLNKATTYAQTSAPTAAAVGDVWINTTSGANTMSRWSGSAWVAVDNATIAATASSLSSLSSTVGGHTTSISTLSSTVAGISANWGVQINSNFAVTGIVSLTAGVGGSDFTVVASRFLYYDPTAGKLPLFSITGGVAYFAAPLVAGLIDASDIIANNVIVTGHLQANSVTNSQVVTAGTSSLSASPSFTTLSSITITTTGGNVMLQFTDWCSWSGSAPAVYYKIVRDGSTICCYIQAGGGSSVPDNISVAGCGLDAGVSAGTHTYTLQATRIGGATTSNDPALIVTELKK